MSAFNRWCHEKPSPYPEGICCFLLQVLSGDGYDTKADVYSLGVVSWEILVGDESGERLQQNFHPESETMPVSAIKTMRNVYHRLLPLI